MTADHYAAAIFEATKGRGEDETNQRIAALLHLLRRNGHMKLLPRIAAAVERRIAEDARGREVELGVAQRHDRERFAPMVDRYREALGVPLDASVRERFDETLIGGFRLRTQGALVDATHKRALLDLYGKLSRVNAEP